MSLEQYSATSMLVTDVGCEMCDNFEMLVTVLTVFVTNILYFFNISVRHQQPKDFSSIQILSLTSKNCHQDKVTNIHLSPTSLPAKKSQYGIQIFLKVENGLSVWG